MLKNLGERIRKLRKAKGVTLVELSEKTGVAQATLSRIETGTMTGTLQSHEKIAAHLGVGLEELYTGVDGRYSEIAHVKDKERKVTLQTKNIRIELLTQESSQKKITPMLVVIQPGAESQPESNERGVEKFLYVLEGSIAVKVDKDEYALNSEDTLYFDASLRHQIFNRSTRPARLFVTVSPSKI